MTCKCGKAKYPSFGIKDGKPLCCKLCKTEEMINLSQKRKLCECGSGKHKSHGYTKDRKRLRCTECKKEDMTDLRKMYCIKCKKVTASYGIKLGKSTHCVSCKSENMIYSRGKVCKCGRPPTYGITGKSATHCFECKTENMTIMYKKKYCKCGKSQPNYGYKDDNTPLYCVSCKLDGMINIKSPKCKCGKSQPNYGYEDDTKPLYCVSCKLDNMINIKSPRCKCGKSQPNYGFKDDKKPLYCASCKLDGMTNIKMKKCVECNKREPYYGNCTDKNPKYCGNCKKDDMINLRKMKCICGKSSASFGIVGDIPKYCLECKTDDMINVRRKYCKLNEDYDKDLNDLICMSWSNPKYDGYCTHCFINLHPSDKRTKNIGKKSKEMKVVTEIVRKYEGFIHDKPLYIDFDGGCCETKRRIDLRKLIGNTWLCIEIDERQHKDRYKYYENIRYNNLFMDWGGKFVFIRYNPDKYKDENNIYIDTSFENRMDKLNETIDKCIENIEKNQNKDFLSIHHLFYDENSPKKDVDYGLICKQFK